MEDITDALARDVDVSLTCLPDGSVDRRYAVEDATGGVETRRDLGRRIATGHAKSFLIDHEGTKPGGQAVNAARQGHALGAETTLYGHLDHEAFDGLPFATHSMGRPADVAVFEFDDDAVMFTEESPDIAGWTLDDLDAASDVADPFDADAIMWTNWASTGNGTAALRALADRERGASDASNGDGGSDDLLVVDPGDVTVCERDAVGPFLDALANIGSFDTVLSVNDDELTFLTAAIDDDGDGDVVSGVGDAAAADRLERVRTRAGLDLAVLHAESAAVARTAASTTRCPNLDVDAQRYTGGGDRFSAGLAYALAADWALPEALTLANACATFYVAHAETAGPDRLAAWLATRVGDA